MNLTRFLLTTLFVLSGTTFINAQENTCTLKIEQASELRGFRLGMTVEQAKARFPFIRVQVDNNFEFQKNGWIRAEDLKEGGDFKGVSNMSLLFLDDKLISVDVSYDQSIEWKDNDQFSMRVSKLLNLPSAWQNRYVDGYEQILECDGFQVKASLNRIGLGNAVEHENLKRRAEEQTEKKKEDRRQTFRP